MEPKPRATLLRLDAMDASVLVTGVDTHTLKGLVDADLAAEDLVSGTLQNKGGDETFEVCATRRKYTRHDKTVVVVVHLQKKEGGE